MSRGGLGGRRAGGSLAALAVLAVLAPLARAAEPGEPALVPGDGALLARTLAESAVERSLPGADWKAWIVHLGREVAEWIFGFLGAGLEAVAHRAALWQVVGVVVAFLAVTALVWRLVQWLRARRRVSPGAVDGGELTAEPPGPARGRSAAAWRRELERHLAAGRLPEALEATWWWLASSLVADGRVDPAWTNRELLVRAGAPGERRRALALLLARFDCLAYGPLAATGDQVRELVAGMEAALT